MYQSNLTLPLELVEQILLWTSETFVDTLKTSIPTSSYTYLKKQFKKRRIQELVRTAFRIPKHMIFSGYRVRKWLKLEEELTLWMLSVMSVHHEEEFIPGMKKYLETFRQEDVTCPTVVETYKVTANRFIIDNTNGFDVFCGFFIYGEVAVRAVTVKLGLFTLWRKTFLAPGVKYIARKDTMNGIALPTVGSMFDAVTIEIEKDPGAEINLGLTFARCPNKVRRLLIGYNILLPPLWHNKEYVVSTFVHPRQVNKEYPRLSEMIALEGERPDTEG